MTFRFFKRDKTQSPPGLGDLGGLREHRYSKKYFARFKVLTLLLIAEKISMFNLLRMAMVTLIAIATITIQPQPAHAF
ncbi:MAG: hypothetical protein AAFX51_08035, partial [Cyanobacteria bacterium J06636_28]